MFNEASQTVFFRSTCLTTDAENHASVEEEFGSFEIPPSLSEDSMEDAIPPDNIVPNYEVHPVEFELIMSSSQHGKEKLVGSRGFSYAVKRKCNNGNVFWRCAVGNKTATCLATVRQQDSNLLGNSPTTANSFYIGPHEHRHQPVPGVGIAATAVADTSRNIGGGGGECQGPHNIYMSILW